MLLLLVGCLGIDNGLTPFAEPLPIPIDSGYTFISPSPEDDSGFIPWEAYDVLVVYDTSGSMGDEVLIPPGASQIPEELTNAGSDWQLVIISADAERDIAWEVDPMDPDPEWSVLEGIHYLLAQGAPNEVGIDAALAFYDRNPNWFRADATTLIVFISDEEDQSKADPSTLVNTWPHQLEIVAVVGLEEANRNPEGDKEYYCTADEGHRYLQIATRQVDICTTVRWGVF